MLREAKKLIFDALEAARTIQQHVAGITFTRYCEDRFFRHAIEREFEIIGKALNRLSRKFPEIAEGIPSLRQIVDFRNQISHGYDTVEDRVVWDIIRNNLPALIEVLAKLEEQP